MYVIQFVSDTGTQHALISGPGPDPGYEQTNIYTLTSTHGISTIYTWNEIGGSLCKLKSLVLPTV